MYFKGLVKILFYIGVFFIANIQKIMKTLLGTKFFILYWRNYVNGGCAIAGFYCIEFWLKNILSQKNCWWLFWNHVSKLVSGLAIAIGCCHHLMLHSGYFKVYPRLACKHTLMRQHHFWITNKIGLTRCVLLIEPMDLPIVTCVPCLLQRRGLTDSILTYLWKKKK